MIPYEERSPERLQSVFEYHQASKHGFDAFASGPGFLDWASQPDPFRRYPGARLIRLERAGESDGPGYDSIFPGGRFPAAAALNRETVSRLFFDSLALSAWKRAGASSWALRVNASSGNLHPTEGYLVCGPVPGLCERPMVCHYAPREHALEVRAQFDAARWDALSAGFPPGTCFLGLTSIYWREAWKYGIRAYRYCMHDAGHALGALSIAAAGLGRRMQLLDEPGTDELAALLGTAQPHDAEPEAPDLLLACVPGPDPVPVPTLPASLLQSFAELAWQGRPNTLSPSHVAWGIEAFAARLHKPHGVAAQDRFATAPRSFLPPSRPLALRRLIRRRRSAVALDGRTGLPRTAFYRMLDRTLAVPGAVPFATLPWRSHLHLVLLVHRVEDLPRGVYLLVRDPAQAPPLTRALTQADPWQKPPGCPASLPLYRLIEADTRAAAREIACQQDIASDGAFSLAMLAEFRAPLLDHGPWFYPRLYWEAGMIGQLLYLEAEAAGIRATGIGCFFDDPMHAVLGILDDTWQDLYHFTVGGPVEDARLTTLPAYG